MPVAPVGPVSAARRTYGPVITSSALRTAGATRSSHADGSCARRSGRACSACRANSTVITSSALWPAGATRSRRAVVPVPVAPVGPERLLRQQHRHCRPGR